jgi:hypothetical protein
VAGNQTSSAMTARVIPANDFVAESLEEEATRLPPSESAKARILRQAANLYRTLKKHLEA